jgi:predicted protein tyrosine phosphatase
MTMVLIHLKYTINCRLSLDLIQKHGRVVTCCVAGISRNNAIVLGALVRYFHIDFYDAWVLLTVEFLYPT